MPIELSKHLDQRAKAKGVDMTLVEVKNAGHGIKPVRGSNAAPSMTWNETQKVVIKQVIEWVKQK